ncbi:MAG: tRNA (guanosine(46)-N7)-methyltransferase TrmB [Acidobacteria bacterium]|nr:MAG: tRNA (guanosine(46)-N7)-methyltransferase TrmB [Acidobacteriota bacterium]
MIAAGGVPHPVGGASPMVRRAAELAGWREVPVSSGSTTGDRGEVSVVHRVARRFAPSGKHLRRDEGPPGSYHRRGAGVPDPPPGTDMTLPDLPVASRRTDELIRLPLPAEGEGPYDLAAIFGNDHPVELEIGVGKGRFLLLAATAFPDRNFIGVEYARRYLEKSIDRLGKRALTNVRLVHAEATQLLDRGLADESISAVHVYFPDPWPKKRHHKRRLIRPDVLDRLARVMKEGALLRIVTDHEEYAGVIRERLAADDRFGEADTEAALWALPGMDDYIAPGVTNFEIKYLREGRRIHRFAYRRL